jgi:hypothetical protein
LVLNVFHDHFVGNITRAGDKIAACPHMTPPKCAAEAFILHKHFTRRFTLNRLDQLAHRNMRWNRDEYMDMVFGNMATDYLDILGSTNLTDQLTSTLSDISTKYRLAVFSDPNQMIFDVINGVARTAVVLHTASILKSSPKGEGFSPIPRGGQ